MSNRLLLLAAALVWCGAGCTGTIRTRHEEAEPAHFQTQGRLAVARFEDGRPKEETEPDVELWRQLDVPHWQDGYVGAALSREVALWLESSGAFQDVVWEPLSSPDPTAEELTRLREKGYDLVLIGEVRHFHGVRRWDLDRSALLLPAGVFGTAAGLLFGHHAEGTTELAPLRLVRTIDGATIWEGAAKGNLHERTRLVEDAGGYANDSLGLACADLVRALDRDSEAIACGLGRDRVVRGVLPAEDVGSSVELPVLAQIEDLGDEAGGRFDDMLDRVIALLR